MNVLAGFHRILLSVVLCVCFEAQARDLGVIGPHRPIVEEDLLMAIERRLQQQQDSGALDRHQAALKAQAKAYARRPPGIHLPRAQTGRTVVLDPVYVLQEDLLDAEGRTLFRAGTAVNPLAIRPLTRTVCFIDGDDEAQGDWLQAHCMDPYRHKRILVQGDVQALSEQLGARLYFDQRGLLTQRLGLQALPATLRQQGAGLYVEEYPLH